MGNLIPMLFWLPLMGAGVLVTVQTGQILGWGLALVCAAQVAAWLVLNWTGLFDNRRMRKALEKEFAILKPHFRGFKAFVGFSSGKHPSILDPHEDVGFLLLSAEHLEFVGDTQMLALTRAQIFGVRFRPNVHSLVGLGRWISIEGRTDGQPFEWRVEPRDRDSLIGNLVLGRALKSRIENWLQRREPQA